MDGLGLDRNAGGASVARGGSGRFIEERMRKGLAALADLKAAGVEPIAAVQKAKEQAQLGDNANRPSKMILELWNLNVERMSDAGTLEALRAGKMPEPPLKRP